MVPGQAAKLKYKLTHANDHEPVSSSFINLHFHAAFLLAVLSMIFSFFSEIAVIALKGHSLFSSAQTYYQFNTSGNTLDDQSNADKDDQSHAGEQDFSFSDHQSYANSATSKM